MIHTMWNRMDDYMVMYIKIGQKDEALGNKLTITCKPLLSSKSMEQESNNYAEFLEVKP
jgi:hypothetical protein